MYTLWKTGQDLWGKLPTLREAVFGGSAAIAVANIILLATEPSETATQLVTVATTSGSLML